MLGLMANVMQFIEFATGVYNSFSELVADAKGMTKEDRDTELLTMNLLNDLETYSHSLSHTSERSTHVSPKFKETVEECKVISVDLLQLVRSFRVQRPGVKWKSVKAVVKRQLKKGNMAILKERLDNYRKALEFSMVGVLRYACEY